MKDGTRITIALGLIAIALGLIIWANIIMRNYEGYLEIMKAARAEAAPQFITGLILLTIGYALTYKFKK